MRWHCPLLACAEVTQHKAFLLYLCVENISVFYDSLRCCIYVCVCNTHLSVLQLLNPNFIQEGEFMNDVMIVCIFN